MHIVRNAIIAAAFTGLFVQAQFNNTNISIDVDADGIGEHGYFAEMAGSVALRGSGIVLQPAVLSGALGIVNIGYL